MRNSPIYSFPTRACTVRVRNTVPATDDLYMTPDRSTATRSDTGRPVVLLVDDDRDLRRLAEMQLSLQGFQVLQAEDGLTALELARSKAPDVILLDMMLPGMTGADVLRALHADPSTEDIPVIFLSALGA